MKKTLVIGTNDIATATALRLFRAGYDVAMVCQENPLDLYHSRNFSTVIVMGSKTINGIKALTFADFIYNQPEKTTMDLSEFIEFSFRNRRIPVLTFKDYQNINHESYEFIIVADSESHKSLNQGQLLNSTLISCVENCSGLVNYSIFINNEYLGQVKYPFIDYAEHTSKKSTDELSVYSRNEGVFISGKNIGDAVKKGDVIAHIDDQIVLSENDGYVDGQVRDGLIVPENIEIIRLQLSEKDIYYNRLPSSSFAVAGGVLEAILYHSKSDSNK